MSGTTFTNTRKLVFCALMSALCVALRVAFSATPFVKPVAFIVIISGVSLGATSGFCVGAVGMAVSNFYFGQGSWTIFQIIAFGVLGAVSGWIFHNRKNFQKPLILSVYGFLSYILVVGPILDSSWLRYTMSANAATIITAIVAGFPYNVVSGITTAVFMLLLSKPILKVLGKYII